MASVKAAQLSRINGAFLRGDKSCMARANSSLPVPDSPRSKSGGVGAGDDVDLVEYRANRLDSRADNVDQRMFAVRRRGLAAPPSSSRRCSSISLSRSRVTMS